MEHVYIYIYIYVYMCVCVFFDFLTLEDGTDTLSRNVGKGLPLNAA